MIREVLALVQTEIDRHRIIVHDLLEPFTEVVGVRPLLQQVVLNLVINAVEAMADVPEQDRRLVIRSEYCEFDDGPCISVEVRDAGIGIEPELLDRIFESFYTTKAHGLGLGLSISRSIIEAHGGRLWATRNAACGMTFHFSLPCGGTGDR